MTYQQRIEQLSADAAQLVDELWQLVVDGRLDLDDFRRILADFVAASRARGAAAAQVAFRGVVEAATGAPGIITPTPVAHDRARLLTAISTIMADDAHDTLMQVKRLAANEPIQAAVDAMAAELAASDVVTGWRRGLDSDPCQLCRWWARDGRVWLADHPMPRHKGCACLQVPVVDLTTANYQNSDQATDRRRERGRR